MVGSIEERGPNTWRLVVAAGTNKRGKRVKITRTVHGTRREAEKMLAKLQVKVDEGSIAESPQMTVADWYAIWFKEYVEAKLAGRTRVLYEYIFRVRVLPALGRIQIDKLTPRHIQVFVQNLGETGVRKDNRKELLSPTSITRHLRILASCLQEAVYRQLIPLNPARNVRAPTRIIHSQQFYNEAQIQLLLQSLQNESPRLRALLLMAITTGIRRGELVALEWSHIDIKTRTMQICQAAELMTGQPQHLKTTKTQGSLRTVIVPSIVIDALQALLNEQEQMKSKMGSLWHDTPFIFTEPNGRWMRADEISKQFRKFLKRHHLPVIPFHGLRHTAATLLIAQGVPVRTVANVLGHTQTSTTLNIYSHALESSNRHAADIMDELLAPDESEE
jgi:integrase